MHKPHDAGSHSQPVPLILAPCPFCGRNPYLHHGQGDITYILCDTCGAITSFRPNFKGREAILAWNNRAADQAGKSHE